MRRAVLAAVCAAIAFAGAGCDDNKPELRDALRLKAVPPAGHKLTSQDLDRSAAIIRHRLVRLGVDSEVSRRGADTIVVAVPASVHLSAEAAGLLAKTGLLEFYDFEAVLTGPSATRGLVRAPVAKPSLVGLLGKRLAIPPNTVVVSCRVADGTCLSTRPLTGTKAFYLFKNTPAMTGRDLSPFGTRAAIDPQTNQPVVVVRFTPRGKRVFQEITRREAQRGALICAGRLDLEAVQSCAQHFAIVLDHEIVSLPYIDFVRNPDGIPGDNGAQIELDLLREAKRVAVAIQTGALPVRFVRLP
jgi:preprotein translocase subunit SecD